MVRGGQSSQQEQLAPHYDSGYGTGDGNVPRRPDSAANPSRPISPFSPFALPPHMERTEGIMASDRFRQDESPAEALSRIRSQIYLSQAQRHAQDSQRDIPMAGMNEAGSEQHGSSQNSVGSSTRSSPLNPSRVSLENLDANDGITLSTNHDIVTPPDPEVLAAAEALIAFSRQVDAATTVVTFNPLNLDDTQPRSTAEAATAENSEYPEDQEYPEDHEYEGSLRMAGLQIRPRTLEEVVRIAEYRENLLNHYQKNQESDYASESDSNTGSKTASKAKKSSQKKRRTVSKDSGPTRKNRKNNRKDNNDPSPPSSPPTTTRSGRASKTPSRYV